MQRDCGELGLGSCNETPPDARWSVFHFILPSQVHMHAEHTVLVDSISLGLTSTALACEIEFCRRSVTYQKKPKTSADTGNGPCDEEEKDGPEGSEDGIAGRHGGCFVDLLLTVVRLLGLGGRFLNKP